MDLEGQSHFQNKQNGISHSKEKTESQESQFQNETESQFQKQGSLDHFAKNEELVCFQEI